MKKGISFVLIVVVLLSFSINILADSQIAPCYDNVAMTDTIFNISSSGNAKVTVSFEGSPEIISGATIKTKIQKRFLFFFWQDVTEWVDEVAGSYYTNSHSITVDSGTYKAIVEYTIRGTGGDPDVITDEIERTH